jgi:putative Ca2+/H+ antiporter (TMEM165/GDT1 family)
VSLIATVLKFGDRTQIGAVHLATSLVADLQLIAAGVVWVWAVEISAGGLTAVHTASMVSLSGGALLANLVSVVLLVTETVSFHRG